jgi:hypothetical protein
VFVCVFEVAARKHARSPLLVGPQLHAVCFFCGSPAARFALLVGPQVHAVCFACFQHHSSCLHPCLTNRTHAPTPPPPYPRQVVAVKAPGFGERKTSYLEDIAILTGGTMVKDEMGIALDKAGDEVLGTAAKVGVGG